MFIVDAHQHLGSCRVFDLNQTEEDLLAAMDQNGVAVAVVQPLPGAPDAVAVHGRIAELSRQYPGRIFGMVNLNPHTDPDKYFAEAARCVRELGFVAVKLHTIGHAVLPLSKDAEMVFDTARQLGVPVMVHTGAGIPFASPSLIIPRARQFPDVKIVLAHSGGSILSAEAYVTAKECPNVYLETSWCPSTDIAWMVRDLGANRVMLGADLVGNMATELTKYRSQGLSESELEASMGRTAIEVYNLKLGAAK